MKIRLEIAATALEVLAVLLFWLHPAALDRPNLSAEDIDTHPPVAVYPI